MEAHVGVPGEVLEVAWDPVAYPDVAFEEVDRLAERKPDLHVERVVLAVDPVEEVLP